MGELSTTESVQQRHFDALASRYEAHYGDAWSQAYRRRFINRVMFDGIDLAGRAVVDAMCGNGETTAYLVECGARVTGVDISPQEIGNFRRRWPACEARCASVLATGLPDGAYDVVAIVGGLHHVHPYVSAAVAEVHRLLKPGGFFCFTEPHGGSLPDLARRAWYRRDRLFAENEAAIDLDGLEEEFAGRFDFRRARFQGNLAYLLVLNSMVLRVPLRWKPLYAPLLLGLEGAIGRLQGRRLSCFAVCQWQKPVAAARPLDRVA